MHWVSIESREEEDIQWFSGWFVRYFFREKNRRKRGYSGQREVL